MPELIDAGMIKDAVTWAGRRLKIAQVTGTTTALVDDGNQEVQLVQTTQPIDLIAAWTGLALFIALLAIAEFVRRNPDSTFGRLILNSMHKMKSCLLSAYETLKMKVAPGKNKEHVKKEIKASIEDFRSVKENLKLLQSQKINKKDVKDIKAAIRTVRSIEENLKLIKPQNINEEVKKQIQDALMPAIVAVQAMEEIINKGVWLL